MFRSKTLPHTRPSVLERPVMERAKDHIGFAPRAVAAELERVATAERSLYGLEDDARDVLDRKRESLNALLAEDHDDHVAGYARLDPVVLTWRRNEMIEMASHDTGHKVPAQMIAVPELAVYGLSQPTLVFVVDYFNAARWKPGLPPFMQTAYNDLHTRLYELTHKFNRSFVALQSTFHGVVPTETKEKIKEARDSGEFEDFRVIADAPSWDKEVSIVPDPIVVGIAKKQMWVIDVFDPTPVEAYIASEFVT